MTTPSSDDPPVRPLHTGVVVWLVVAAVVVAAVSARVWGPRGGCTILCLTLVALGVARALGPEPGLPGVAVRSRTFDVAGYLVLAALLGGLAWTTGNLAG
ncbi:DUF3017 domain-containing protein [Luteimicrobium subarcticum]|uniref:DUF3017 domain-containing protein n=1 Tax=Luteimicrobium subarcticum TaxID=620910 RepID=UPI0012FDEF84|nr:DUF3017 domain-containing protein [Luteimicrobium subarcticum]